MNLPSKHLYLDWITGHGGAHAVSMDVHVCAYCRQVCVCMCSRYRCVCVCVRTCVHVHVLILRAGAETPVFAPAAFPHQCLYCGVGSRGKGRGPSSVQLRVLNEGSSVAASAEDICRCLELSQPGPWEGGGLPTVGLGTTLKRLPKLDPLQEVLPGPDSVLLLGTLRGASVVMVGLGAVKAAAPSNFWHLGAVPH
uniref:Uncharacterized protein n=1 Tax=Pipistrellus kuhlii TaxID=59472 RepID=A0A7J7UAB0_PIPKU|nr:hypothetical protein mPipKuh1_009136 [Pipistrellus kuhlii]